MNKNILSTKKIFSILAVLLFTFIFSSCKKESIGSTSNNNNNTNDTTTSAYAGNWAISLYWDDVDETNDFAGYTFIFGASNVLTAFKNGNSVTGSWTLTSTKLIIDFGTDPVLQELNDDWLISEKTTTTIKLKEDNPDRDDKLEFIKL